MSRVVLSIGSNLGDRLAYLQSVVDGLRPALVAVSPVYETDPVGPVPQCDYLNAVIIAAGPEDAADWLERARTIEAAAGRLREQRWGPRTLDVDVVAVDDLVSDDPALTLPHAGAHQRAFVLLPWLDVEPDAVLPEHGRVQDLVKGVDLSGVRRRNELVLR